MQALLMVSELQCCPMLQNAFFAATFASISVSISMAACILLYARYKKLLFIPSANPTAGVSSPGL